MIKQEVKTLCEADDKLQWWAALLFAEISELEQQCHPGDEAACWSLTRAKVKEFPKLVIQRQLEQAAGKRSRLDELEQRVAKLEEQRP